MKTLWLVAEFDNTAAAEEWLNEMAEAHLCFEVHFMAIAHYDTGPWFVYTASYREEVKD